VSALTTPLERGREEVRAAQVLLEAGLPSQAVSRACAAAVNAAQAALWAVGETPSTSAGVVAAFSRRVIADDRHDPQEARALRRLFEDRNDVDHAHAQASADEAAEAIAAAQGVVAAAVRFIETARAER
jgi:uncharacterized protein (UPF0332 family)